MKTRTKWTLQTIAIALIVGSYVLGEMTADPTGFALPLLVAKYLGLANGTISLVLHFLPSPRQLHS